MKVRISVVVVAHPRRVYDLDVALVAAADELRDSVANLVRLPLTSFWVVYRGRVVRGEWCVGTFGIYSNSKVHVVFKPKLQVVPRREDGTTTTTLFVLSRILEDAKRRQFAKAKEPRRRATTRDGQIVLAVEASTAASRAKARQSEDYRVLRESELWAHNMRDAHPLLRWRATHDT